MLGRILLVDDNPASLYSTGRMLRAAGFDLIEATTGTEAIATAAAHPIDLVVLDVNLPDVDGFEVCRRIRANPITARVRVVYLSASFVDDVHRVRGYEAGADGYLTHPVEPSVLIATVGAFLRNRVFELEREEALRRERLALAESERANRAKDEFLATLSHELRSPLNAILGWAEVGRIQCRDLPEATHAFEVIARNARFQAQLVSDLLDVSRITSGKVSLDREPVQAASIVRASLEHVTGVALARNVTIESRLDGDVGIVLADPVRFKQIVVNLVSNAVKFSDEGARVVVTLQASNGHLELQVRDEGRGIRPEDLERIFDRFWQEDTTSRRSHSGLGLGLAIVRSLTELHGGTVRAESAGEGKGATFTVCIPTADAATGSAVIPPGPVITPTRSVDASSLNGVKLLIVDDDADARQWVRRVLALAGAEVRDVGDVGQALLEVDRETPDVIISDLAMPRQDGFDLLGFLRDRGHTREELPAIAISAVGSAEQRHRALDASFEMLLSKPIDPSDLIDAVRTVARRSVADL